MPQGTSGKNITSTAQLADGVVESADIALDTIAAVDIAPNAVGDSEIAAHTTTKITVPTTLLSGTVGSTQITDDAVTLAKMAAGTAGNLITFNASGDPAAVATGTAGQVLTSGGAGAAPTFGAVPAATFFVPCYSSTGAWDRVDATCLGEFLLPATGTTTALGGAFMPTGTIASIQLYVSNDANTGNVVLQFNFADLATGAFNTDTGNQTVNITAAETQVQIITVTATNYTGITQGRPWGFGVTRLGDDGSDAKAGTLRIHGFLVNF